MRVVFIDIETTGLDHNKHSIWQIAYVLSEQLSEQKTLKLLEAKEMLLLPFGKKLPATFIKDVEQADLIVAHNVRFERAFFYNYNLYISRKKSYCTMLKSKDLCNIKCYVPDRNFSFTKYPRLSEAIEALHLGQVHDAQLHDALYDVFLVVKLYAYIEKLEVDSTNLKIYKQPKLLKQIYKFLFSPFEKETRQEIKDKLLSPFTTVKSLKFKLENRIKRKKEDFPLTFEG
ncbi:MAG: 3'-5' exonuclease [Desulfurococcaceae archaeon]